MTVFERDPHDASSSTALRCGSYTLDLSRPRVMGIVNLTTDSFSDGGRFVGVDDAVRHAHRLVDEGADVLDLGAESTRPGALPVAADEELARLLPVMAALRHLAVPISIDTRKPAVMRRVIDAGAAMINDIGGFASDEARGAVALADCGLCVMHMQGEPGSMQDDPHYDDVVADVARWLRSAVDALKAAGVSDDRIVVDPGFGFGKTLAHNVALLRELQAIAALGHPVLVGLSRKSMIGTLTGRPVDRRLAGSIAAALVAVERGAALVRVHDVAATVDALAVWTAARAGAGDSIRRLKFAERGE